MSREFIKKHKILAKKSLGQNFLIDEKKVQEIADIFKIEGENIVEVGPGYGALTEKILEKNPKKLQLVELDADMIQILQERFGDHSPDFLKTGLDVSVNIFHQDVLTFFPDFSAEKYRVIANIPYYITSPILHHFLYIVDKKPENMLILMQDDVAQKILGGKKNKSSVLRLMIEKKAKVSSEIFVPKESFYPIPKVESRVLSFKLHSDFDVIDDKDFLECMKKGFSEARKKLTKNLQKAGYDVSTILSTLSIMKKDENIRAEDLDINNWIFLFDALHSKK